ncbi:CDC27 family protein [Hydrogenimonas cancrithermarum]|uniref:Transformation system protein n=1 Tax=Hydrogenimonas cancrithermarum TaxID=2993563 RepID=A0ABM8FI79_9BACT|nr:CDC27 family protein [Hydrogenimonas cancrithermarum]BDY11988.1 hypothetical protein HCR_03000 [Hydrogenimonas cancrithermarum]
MLEIEKLEKEWRVYKIKRLRPWAILGLAAAISYGLFLAWPAVSGMEGMKKSSTASRDTRGGKSLERPLVDKKEVLRKPPASTLPVTTQLPSVAERSTASAQREERKEKRAVLLNPDTAFLSSFSRDADWDEPKKRRYARPVKEETIHPSSNLEKREPKTVVKLQNTAPISGTSIAKSSLSIQTKTSNNTLDYLIKRFNVKRDPKLATYIAQSFYKKKNYNEAVKWSIMANSLEPSNEESWLLYARAKVKLGKKEDAINALRIYLNQYSSRKVKSYLHSLEHSL